MKLKVLKIHDDGDMTVKQGGQTYVTTTEGQVFKEVNASLGLRRDIARVAPDSRHFERDFEILKKRAEAQGFKIKLVSSKTLGDYEAMNPEAAKVFGRKQPGNMIEIEQGLPPEKKYRDLNHELIERRLMAGGMKYWPAHRVASRREGSLPKAPVLKLGKVRRLSGGSLTRRTRTGRVR